MDIPKKGERIAYVVMGKVLRGTVVAVGSHEMVVRKDGRTENPLLRWLMYRQECMFDTLDLNGPQTWTVIGGSDDGKD